MCTTWRALTILFLSFGFAPAALSATYTYRLTEIPIQTDSYKYAAAINNAGQVSGSFSLCNSDCSADAFIWSGSMAGKKSVDLYGLLTTDYEDFVIALDINSSGKATGLYRKNTAQGQINQAYYWDGATKKLLGTLGGEESYGSGINAKGWITGWSHPAGTDHQHAFLWDGVTMRDLGTLGGETSMGRGINLAGKVVGGTNGRAFLWNGIAMRDLGTLGGSLANATAINDKVQVVGTSQISGNGFTHAFLWHKGLMQDLTPLLNGSSEATAINNYGQVVGSFGSYEPFLWENGTTLDVNELIPASDPLKPYKILRVSDINDAGQMSGDGWLTSNGPYKLLLISPAYTLSSFLKPTLSNWRRGSTVTISIAALDAKGVRIPDGRAGALVAQPGCKVKVFATGAQKLASTCMKYDAAANVFWLDWKLAGTGTGTATITARVNYGSPGPLKVQKTKNITVTT